ncbi:hypothetical protein PGT21_009992 [Puccinia graminis f. sp. tritici]|uniref:Uncharacterized protein n=1 Tax=Puccinia graminis f. sp. tritici TaxID=56615 RepID=A0A5B0MBX8_PUCGR|nr:hypothetical protein PGT21_009992 [Puccinia graminis f. sp. tritici]
MTNHYSVSGCQFVDEPLFVTSDGSIVLNFTNTTVPLSHRLNTRDTPQFSIVAKPMSLATSRGGPWLIYYGTIDLSQNSDVLQIRARVSYWQGVLPLCDVTKDRKLVSTSKHPFSPSLSLLNHRHPVRLLTHDFTQHHKFTKPGMKSFIFTAALCGAAFASIVGAMNVIIEGKEVKPTIPQEGVTTVNTEIFECKYCEGAGCRRCQPETCDV